MKEQYRFEILLLLFVAALEVLCVEPLSGMLQVSAPWTRFFLYAIFAVPVVVRLVVTWRQGVGAPYMLMVGALLVVLSLILFRDPLVRYAGEKVWSSFSPNPTEASESQPLDRSAAEVLSARRSATRLGRNSFGVSDLTYDFHVKGRTATLVCSGTIASEIPPSVMKFVTSSDAVNIDPATFRGLVTAEYAWGPAGGIPDAQQLKFERAEHDIRVTHTNPLTLFHQFRLPPSLRAAKRNKTDVIYFRIACCWPGAAWRVTDLLLIDTSVFEKVVGNLNATVVSSDPITCELVKLGSEPFDFHDITKPTSELSSTALPARLRLSTVGALPDGVVGSQFVVSSAGVGQACGILISRPLEPR